jgi:hypothetical protein
MASGRNSRSAPTAKPVVARSGSRTSKAKHREADYEEDDYEDDYHAQTSGLHEVGVSSRGGPASSLADRPAGTSALRLASQARRRAFHVALEKHEGALQWLDQKMSRANEQGLFTVNFAFSEVDGLVAASHAEYVGFIQLLDILEYNAKYTNGSEKADGIDKDKFYPSTRIFVDCLPKKR